jgi:hypothetical protein
MFAFSVLSCVGSGGVAQSVQWLGYGLDDTGVRLPAGASYRMATEDKAAVGGADYSFPSSPEVKNAEATPPLPNMYFVKHRDNFTFHLCR